MYREELRNLSCIEFLLYMKKKYARLINRKVFWVFKFRWKFNFST